MAKREAALSGGDGGIVSVATCKDLGHKRIELSVIASVSEAIERVRSPDTFDWVIARGDSLVAIKRVGILCLLIATLAVLARNDKK